MKHEQTNHPMLEILKSRLPDGLKITKVKDRASASQIQLTFSYNGTQAVGWLYKTCVPGCEKKVCDHTIASAMLSVALKQEDLEMAELWKNKLLSTT